MYKLCSGTLEFTLSSTFWLVLIILGNFDILEIVFLGRYIFYLNNLLYSDGNLLNKAKINEIINMNDDFTD